MEGDLCAPSVEKKSLPGGMRHAWSHPGFPISKTGHQLAIPSLLSEKTSNSAVFYATMLVLGILWFCIVPFPPNSIPNQPPEGAPQGRWALTVATRICLSALEWGLMASSSVKLGTPKRVAAHILHQQNVEPQFWEIQMDAFRVRSIE